MQAIVWLKNEIETAGDNIKILIADAQSYTESVITLAINDGMLVVAPYDNIVFGDSVDNSLWILQESDGVFMGGVLDVRSKPE